MDIEGLWEERKETAAIGATASSPQQACIIH
jgi:hypothetical protein